MDLVYISNDLRSQIFRFHELVELFNKADGRRHLTFEDLGYVEDIDLFLTGIICHLPVNISLDGSTLDWKILNYQKEFKTMLDFYTGKIRCQGILYTELQGHERHRFKNAIVTAQVINPGADHKDKLIKYLALK